MTMADLASRTPRRRPLSRSLGFARSLAMYYGRPGQTRRLAGHYADLMAPGDIVFDIGAHVGNRTRCWSRLGALVVAVEPQPHFARWLRWQFKSDAKVTVVEAALGDKAGLATLFESPRTPTVSTMSQTWMGAVGRSSGFAGVVWDEERRTRVTTLDSLIHRFGTPKFCKIDVEGYEAEVLRGLSVPLAALSIEYVPAAMDVVLAALDRLAELGAYRFNVSEGESLHYLWPDWRDADDLRRWLETRAPDAPSGDVYARLID